MKAKKKLLAIALSAVTGVSAFGLALHLTSPNTVSADALPYTITNLEDLVDSGSDIRWTYNTSGLEHLYSGREADANIINKGIQGSNPTYAIFDEAYDETNSLHKAASITYFKKGAAAATTEQNVVINANDYDDNYSFFANEETKIAGLIDGGILLTNVNDKNAVISFNTNYTNRRYDFYSRFVKSATNTYYADPDSTTNGSYYGIQFNTVDTAFLAFRNTVGNVWTTNPIKSGSAKTYTKTQVLAEANTLNNTAYTKFAQVLEKDDIINVTYGTYDGENGNAWTYFRLYNVTKELLVFEEAVDLGAPDAIVYEGDNKTYPDGSPCMMKIGFQYRGDRDNANYDRTPVTIAGVEEPLLANGYDYTVEEGTYTEGNALSSVNNLPAGYEWVDATQTLQADTHEYDAMYTTEYYGQTYTKDCKITVTAEALPSYTLTLKDMNGDTIGTRSVSQGESYTFEPYAAVGGTKTFVAYKVGEYLYKEGETVTPTENSEATLWEADFSIANEGSVRLIDDGTNYGGIRWTMNIDAAAYDVIKNKVSISTMIIPTDLIEGDLEYNEAEAEVKALDAAVLANGTADFAITNIRHFNYNRPYSGTAFMKVEYTKGADYVYAEAKSFSVYELACNALANYTATLNNSNDADRLYSDKGVAMLEKYIRGVIDLTVTDNDTELTVAGSLENGVLGDLGYTVTNATATKVNGSKTTVTISITVDPNSALASLVQAGVAVPVIVRMSDTLDTYKAVEATATAYADGALTVSVKI